MRIVGHKKRLERPDMSIERRNNKKEIKTPQAQGQRKSLDYNNKRNDESTPLSNRPIGSRKKAQTNIVVNGEPSLD
jgi:hypothetical protein